MAAASNIMADLLQDQQQFMHYTLSKQKVNKNAIMTFFQPHSKEQRHLNNSDEFSIIYMLIQIESLNPFEISL